MVDNLIGLEFANGWIIEECFSSSEYKKIYEKLTGDTTKIIKNRHYLCTNKNCGISCYMERTTIKRAIDGKRDCMSKCKGCKNDKQNSCYYSTLCRQKNLYKTPDRTVKIKVGDLINFWKVKNLSSSANYSDHQMRAICTCNFCRQDKEMRVDHLLENGVACDCFKQHSIGEQVVEDILKNLSVKYKAEYTFENLVGLKGGALRYDFAILNNSNKVIGLIEYDGEQHFQEAGTYFNKDGHVQIHDKIKNDFAEENHIPLLRIPFTEILHSKELIQKFLMNILF